MARSGPKQQKSGSGSIVSDRISGLPDSVLHHILSFLPIRQAVATSLLSKRWKPLWLSMPNLNFDGVDFHHLDSFTQFVDAVLCLADMKPQKMFRLNCQNFLVYKKRKHLELQVPPIRINFWINAALNREVEHLELCFPYRRYDVVLPKRIFSCNVLKVLKLTGVAIRTPAPVNLPSLEVMHLTSVQLNDLDCMANLLSGCALLKELLLMDLDVPNSGSKLNIARLEQLVSAKVPSFLIPSKTLTNVTRLQLDVDESPVLEIPTFDYLTNLEISLLDHEHLNWVVECLRSCPKLEILVINEIYEEDDGEGAIMELPLDVPQCLSSHLKEVTLVEYAGREFEFEIARYIMENARVLRSISFCSDPFFSLGEKYKMLKRLSSCPRASTNCRLLFS